MNTNLAAECASISRVLRDFHLLHLLSKRGTITGTVLAHDSHLLRALTLQIEQNRAGASGVCCGGAKGPHAQRRRGWAWHRSMTAVMEVTMYVRRATRW